MNGHGLVPIKLIYKNKLLTGFGNLDCSSLLTLSSFIHCPNTVNLAPYKQSTITLKNKNFN